MRTWPLVWLLMLAFGVGSFAVVSVLVVVKGFGELKAVLRKLARGTNGTGPSP